MDRTPRYQQRFVEALQFAAQEHSGQLRKIGPDEPRDPESGVPYIAHLLAVAAIVWEAGGDEDQAVAGLLHDAVEDQDVPVADIAARFGAEVARIVDACSEHWARGAGGKPPWLERKQAHLERLREADAAVLLVTAADKIHNGESILHDLAVHQGIVWCRFNAEPEQILWYYQSVAKVVAAKLADNPYVIKRFAQLIQALENAVQQYPKPTPVGETA